MTKPRKYLPTQASNSIWAELKLPNEDHKVRALVRSGFSVELLSNLANIIGFRLISVAHSLGITRSMLARRRKHGCFNREESDRIFCLIKVIERTNDFFEGDQKSVRQWLQTSLPALGQKQPIEMLQTTADTMAVLNLITRLEFGVHS
ncbi:type II RES/Xre toxin-antitoxin system antitoxin [Alishewanella tabrizica]|uniref:Antitoxin n=1 Tax=Alishewanella tabrizica TaxID=671278 RepID=A0ABQ2WG04_9ALTE|nr:antitoxin Xre/MbcA/ParS toxin-binding domain-containing protein [Alishewanella tabrizica]GGW54524.1 antitoxin [Alishewanella tabrizica]